MDRKQVNKESSSVMLFHIENLSQNLGQSVINIRPGPASKIKGGCELSERRNVKSISS